MLKILTKFRGFCNWFSIYKEKIYK